MANRAVDAVMGPRQTEVVHTNQSAAAPPAAGPAKCSDESSWVKQCFDNGGNAESCQYYADLLKQCQPSVPTSHHGSSNVSITGVTQKAASTTRTFLSNASQVFRRVIMGQAMFR